MLNKNVRDELKLTVIFYAEPDSGNQPVRKWLRSLPEKEKKAIGEDIKAVQYGWPLGLPLVRHVRGDIWEVRSNLGNRIARILFAVEGALMVLLHGFIKESQKLPEQDLKVAQDRLSRYRSRGVK